MSSQADTIVDIQTKRYFDEVAQFNRLNYVQHGVISMRSIFRAEENFMIETTVENCELSEIDRRKNKRMENGQVKEKE